MSNWSRPQPDSLFAAIDDMRLHYKRTGQGPAILLLHGSGSSLQGFDAVAARLSRAFMVVRLDLPGTGLTGPRPDRDYRIQAYVAVVEQFLRALNLAPCAVVGNSLGGAIAWNLALDYPDRLTALVLVNATGYPEKPQPAGLRLARNPLLRPLLRVWLPRGATERSLRAVVGPSSRVVDRAMVDRVHGLMSLPGNRSAFVDLANTNQPDRSAEIKRISTPTLVLRSAGVDAQHFAQDIRASHESVHPTAGHLLPEEDPAWVASQITAFLKSRAQSSRPLGVSV